MADHRSSAIKSFWGWGIAGTLTLAILGAVVGWLHEHFSHEAWYLAILFGLTFAVVGLFVTLLTIIIYEKFPEMHSADEARVEAIKIELYDLRLWRSLYAEGHPTARKIVVSAFVEQSVRHLLEKGDLVSQSEYLRLLHQSSCHATKRILATSLITPETWLSGRLTNDYKDYLNLQIELKKQHPSLEIKRIFINTSSEFEKTPFKQQIVDSHKSGRLGIGFFDQNQLLKTRNKDFCIDMVLFEDEFGAWVLDGGTLEKSGQTLRNEEGAYIRFVDTNLVNTHYRDIETYLTGSGCVWL